MSIFYSCRYCSIPIGCLEGKISEEQLGFNWLTPEERKDIIVQDNDGDSHVIVVCESCQELIDRNPEWILLSRLFH